MRPIVVDLMRRAIMTILALLPACDYEIQACEYDPDGTPPLVVSPCYRAGLEPLPNPEAPQEFTAKSCESWCDGQGLGGMMTMHLQSPDACPGLSDPMWSTSPADSEPQPGIVRCLCEL